MEFKLEYNFYRDYFNDLKFKTKFNQRVQDIKFRYQIKEDQNYILKNYFVEIFSWTALPYKILHMIDDKIKKYKLTNIIDPSCGNAFHGYLFNRFCNLNTINLDLQDENNSWYPILPGDGRDYLTDLPKEEHLKSVLLLSWIDYEKLCLDFLQLYQGNMVISLGNYDDLSPNYKKKLNQDFNLIQKIILTMPWNLTENIEIYVKKN
jgi:hypothetical protein